MKNSCVTDDKIHFSSLFSFFSFCGYEYDWVGFIYQQLKWLFDYFAFDLFDECLHFSWWEFQVVLGWVVNR